MEASVEKKALLWVVQCLIAGKPDGYQATPPDGCRLLVTAPKSSEGAGDVPIDKELLAMFRGWHAKATSTFVIEADTEPRSATTYAHYRAQPHFDALTVWLREKGVTALKPLHELRKEFGSQLCAKYGIYAASRMLRHADIRVTAQHYLDTKERTPIGLHQRSLHALQCTMRCYRIRPMKRTLSAVAAAVLVSMMALMFLGGLLKKAARVVDGLRNGSG